MKPGVQSTKNRHRQATARHTRGSNRLPAAVGVFHDAVLFKEKLGRRLATGVANLNRRLCPGRVNKVDNLIVGGPIAR